MLRHHLVRHSEGGVERVPLGRRQLDCTLAYGTEHLTQTRKRQVGFRLHAGRGEHRHAALACSSRRLRQQTRLADARIAVQHERSAPAADVIQKLGQDLDLG